MHDLYAKGAPRSKQKRVGDPALTSAAAILSWARENGIDIHAGPGRPRLHDDSPDLEAARLRKENALAAKYELQVERERGEVVSAEDVRRNFVRIGSAFRSRMQGAVASLAVDVADRNGAECHAALQTKFNELLGQLAEDIRRLGGSRHAAAAAQAE
jgi:phage terminase Nu1 subunit (DNA packaging protein)